MLDYIIIGVVGCLSVVAAMSTVYGEISTNEIHTYNFPFFTRSDWFARSPVKTLPLSTPTPYVVIHHTYIPPACSNYEECSTAMREMQRMHIDTNGWWDMGYNFCVGSDGAVYEGRGWQTLGAHSLHFNTVSIGICLIGDWTNKLPPSQQLKTTKALIAAGVELGFIKPEYKLVGHRQVRATECPGEALFKEIQIWEHFSPFPRSYKDLVSVPELSEWVKEEIRNKMTVITKI